MAIQPIRWDQRKAEINLRKHQVTFDEAATVLDDSLSITKPDPAIPSKKADFLRLAIMQA